MCKSYERKDIVKLLFLDWIVWVILKFPILFVFIYKFIIRFLSFLKIVKQIEHLLKKIYDNVNLIIFYLNDWIVQWVVFKSNT